MKSSIFFIFSVLFHFIIVGGIAFISYESSLNSPLKIQKAKTVSSTVHVDIVSMPDLSLEELKVAKIDLKEKVVEKIKKIPAAPEPKAKPKKIKKKPLVKKKIKVATKKKTPKIKPQNQKKRVVKKRVINQSSFQKKLGRLLLKGNVKKKGSATYGEQKSLSKEEWDLFGARVVKFIKPYWELPRNFKEEPTPCLVLLVLKEDGQVSKVEIVSKSKSEIINKRALRAIELAKPFFPIHNKEILNKVKKGELILAFPF